MTKLDNFIPLVRHLIIGITSIFSIGILYCLLLTAVIWTVVTLIQYLGLPLWILPIMPILFFIIQSRINYLKNYK